MSRIYGIVDTDCPLDMYVTNVRGKEVLKFAEWYLDRHADKDLAIEEWKLSTGQNFPTTLEEAKHCEIFPD